MDDDEDHNVVVDAHGAFEREDWMLSHYHLVQLAGLANTERGSVVAGSRGYFLTGMGVRLNQALVSYASQFLIDRGHTMMQTPFVMNKSLMGKVAQVRVCRAVIGSTAAGTTHALPTPSHRRVSRRPP